MAKAKVTDPSVQKLKVKVAQATRILHEWGLADFYGHASARIPGTDAILIKPSMSSFAAIRPKDILTVDMNNYKQGDLRDPLMRQKGLPPGEVILHIAMYRKHPNVLGVVHTHQILATAMGIAGKPIVPLQLQGMSFSPCTPIFDSPEAISNERLAAELAEAIGDHNAILLKSHGVVTVGESIEHATVAAVYLERAAKIQIIATLMGTPVPMDHDFCNKNFGQIGTLRFRDAFDCFVSLLGSPMKGLM